MGSCKALNIASEFFLRRDCSIFGMRGGLSRPAAKLRFILALANVGAIRTDHISLIVLNAPLVSNVVGNCEKDQEAVSLGMACWIQAPDLAKAPALMNFGGGRREPFA